MRVPLALSLALTALLSGCGQDPASAPVALSGGNGSETTNGFTLLILKEDGTPAPGAAVRVRPSDSLAGAWGDSLAGRLRTRLDTVSDSEGYVTVNGLARGNYTLEMRLGDARSLAHQSAQAEIPYGGSYRLTQAGTPRLEDLRLANCALALQGVDRRATANAKGYVQFDSLPTGVYAFRAWKNGKRYGDGTFLAQTGTSAQLLSFDLVGSDNDPSQFPHASILSINAGIGHGNIRDTLLRFPIPLLLTEDNFDFTGATPSGLRFISASDRAIPYEVESWDAKTKTAQLWLRPDTLLGLVDNQMIRMYWGGATQPALGPTFDTSDAWTGAWLLRQSLRDATPAQRTATGSPAGLQGWSSSGTNTLELPGLPETSEDGFTLSLWLLPDTAQRPGAPILRQHSADGEVTFALRMGPWSTWIEVNYPDGSTRRNNFPNVSAQGEWLNIAVTYDKRRDEMRLFLNGVQWGETTTNLANSGRNMDGHLVLGGSDSAGVGFKGLVKDLRLSRIPRSDPWINAEYIVGNPASAARALTFQRLR